MSNDLLEQRLRAMLQERAHDIGRAPTLDYSDAGEAPIPLSTAQRLHRSRPLLTAAAVAAVVLIIAVAATIVSRRHPAQPAAPHPPVPLPAIKVNTCDIGLPAAWFPAKDTSVVPANARVTPLTLTPDGQAVVFLNGGTTRTVDLRTATRARTVYTVPDPANKIVSSATTDGRWLVIPVEWMPDHAESVLPTVIAVVVVDLRSGADRVVAQVPPSGTTIDNAVLFDGQVYWDVRRDYATDTGTIVGYDPVTGRQRVVYSGTVTYPEVTAAGLSWTGAPAEVPQLRRALPSVVRDSVGADPPGADVVSDGTAWAWLALDGRIEWWTPGATTIRYVTEPSGAPGQTAPGGELTAVAGPYVSVGSDLIDMRTGGSSTMAEHIVTGLNGRLLMEFSPVPTLHIVAVVDTTSLPPFTC